MLWCYRVFSLEKLWFLDIYKGGWVYFVGYDIWDLVELDLDYYEVCVFDYCFGCD